ncbi:MAG: LPXTG cell wall anchor domain-containing protein [Porphyromonas sp.]|nr:LPXTG cell wall anchor domain-containing protein [Porphyromonas sp.]
MESLGFIQDILHHLNYFWVTVLMAIESSFIPFPSEVVVPPAAYKAATGEMNIFLVVLFATLGSDIGALINYYLARYLGRFLLYTTIGAGSWNVVLALLGYFIGKTVPPELFAETIQRYSTTIGLIILGVLVVGGVGYYLYKRRQKAA